MNEARLTAPRLGYRMQNLPDTAICLGCGDSLRGLPEAVCPECGQPFDPADAGTYRDPAVSFFRARFARPPQRWHRWLVMVVTALVLLDISCPGGFFPLVCFLALAAIASVAVVTFDYLARVVAWRMDRAANIARDDGGNEGGCRWHWLVTPVCLVLMLLALWYPWPAWVRFRLSQPAFERVMTDASSDGRSQLVGLYVVRRVQRFPNGVVFFDTGDDFFNQMGFLFDPADRPVNGPGLDPLYARHRLGARWFTAWLDF